MTEAAAEWYLRLGLQVGRHVDGIVDAYYGPPEIAAAVDAGPPVAPRELVSKAEALLAEVEDGWLRDQVVGLRTYAGVLAGESLSYADEVEGCYGVRPAYTDESVFDRAQAQLDELLPGEGPLGERYSAWERSIRVPPGHVARSAAAIIEKARAGSRDVIELPEGEGVDLQTVRDEPWMAFCEYLGGLRSQMSVNVDLPMSVAELLILAMHETYPGHHAERCLKEQLLVRGLGLLEETIVLVPTPQSLISEGIAKLAPFVLLEADGSAFADVVDDAGVELDLEQAIAIERAIEPLRWAEVNGALMMHEDGAGEAEVRAYLEQWGLMSPELAAHMIRFFGEESSRTYVVTYAAGAELCGAYVAREPDGFRRLLTEQVRVGDLLAE